MKNIKTTTRRLFVTTQIAALGWVTISYLIALYATVRLGQVFPVVDLSKQAIETILGVNVLPADPLQGYERGGGEHL